LFKETETANKGWGVRTLNDIPMGSFVCRYVGVRKCRDKIAQVSIFVIVKYFTKRQSLKGVFS